MECRIVQSTRGRGFINLVQTGMQPLLVPGGARLPAAPYTRPACHNQFANPGCGRWPRHSAATSARRTPVPAIAQTHLLADIAAQPVLLHTARVTTWETTSAMQRGIRYGFIHVTADDRHVANPVCGVDQRLIKAPFAVAHRI